MSTTSPHPYPEKLCWFQFRLIKSYDSNSSTALSKTSGICRAVGIEMNQKKNHFLLHSSSFWGINPTLLSRNIAQRILGHIFAREIAEFACLTGWRADGRVELSQTILGGSNFDFLPSPSSLSRADWLTCHESSGWVDSQKLRSRPWHWNSLFLPVLVLLREFWNEIGWRWQVFHRTSTSHSEANQIGPGPSKLSASVKRSHPSQSKHTSYSSPAQNMNGFKNFIAILVLLYPLSTLSFS